MALGVCAPWLAGIAAGQAIHGSIASFGAYLLTVSFPHLPAGRVRILLVSCLAISLLATVGASVALGSVAFFVLALAAAMAQGVGEVSGGYFRLPVALGTLAFFLSVGEVPAGEQLVYGGTFLAGTLWGAIFVFFCIPSDQGPVTSPRPPLLKDPAQRRFLAGIASVSLLGSIAASFSPGAHPCWLTAAGLRVMKPTRQETIYRMKTRGLGTILGAATGGLLLGLSPIPWLHAAMVGVLVLCMLLIGAKRYGLWTFCLTAIALAFNLSPEAGALEMASSRVLLTVVGIGIAVLMLPLLPLTPKPGSDARPSPSSDTTT